MAFRRRVLQVSDSSSSSSENIAEVEQREVEPAEEYDDIEILDSPELLASSNGGSRGNHPTASRLEPSVGGEGRSSAFVPDTNINISGVHSNTPSNSVPDNGVDTSASFFSPQAQVGVPNPSRLASSRHAALQAILESRGVRPNGHWLDVCVESLEASRPGFSQLNDSQKAEACFSCFLFSDLNSMGESVLPPRFHTLHGIEISGPFVLQVDEIVDIGAPIRQRYKERSATDSRCLKLSMTDGVQHIYGIEYRPIKALNVLSPAGFKVCVHNVNIRRGMLLLVPETIIVLGGQVEQLEAARQRAVQHVNKPPRGARNPRGAASQTLAESASMVAWAGHHTEGTSRESDCETNQSMRASTPGVQICEYTYLSLLKRRWASVQVGDSVAWGKIKCVLTGVKEFHFKDRDEFKLLVHVDDGSLITVVQIHHQSGCRAVARSFPKTSISWSG
ncbi:hypothetical protein KP509_30G025100 [Ceratopteris richardii]|uniref:RecQ-mediated genome instability protein 1 n=1 Tax=Ceratopteris richardii TaxID=49495 RepID=A0A8T2R1M3_CERRI|nr:hypothetical protein KP509_30G025100 [Ceratopteris richardii]